MVIVFAVGFAFLGVGSGGLDLQSLVQDVFRSRGGGGTSVSKAQAETKKHPNDPQAWKKLSTALQSKGRNDEAVVALEHYVKLAPHDIGQLQTLGRLEYQQALAALQAAQAAAANQQFATSGSTFGNSQLTGSDPIANAVSSQTSSQASSTLVTYRTESDRALKTLKKLAVLQHDASSYTQLATSAAQFGNTALELTAYKALLKLETDPRTRAQIRARIKALRRH